MPQRHHVVTDGQLGSFEAHFRAATHFLRRFLGRRGRQAGNRGKASRYGAAEIRGKIVINPNNQVSHFGVINPKGGTKNAVDDFAHDAVTVLILDPQLRHGRAHNPLALILVQAG